MSAIRRGWFHLASGAGVGRLLGFVSNLLLSRWLGPVDLGLFNLVATTVQTSDTLVRCGADYALNYEIGGQSDVSHTGYGIQLIRAFSQICSFVTILICAGMAAWVLPGEGLFPSTFDTYQRLLLLGLLIIMIACEGISASAWEALLVCHRTAPLALKQGLFIPLRVLSAAVGAHFLGVIGAMSGWSLVTCIQCVWLKRILRNLWQPLLIYPVDVKAVLSLLQRGFPFYGANLLSSLIFYPLLLEVVRSAGLADVGYLRAGQILQQLFAFLPATLVPLLFLKLRNEATFEEQVLLVEKPLRLIWVLLLGTLFLYCFLDQYLVKLLFGNAFTAALLPTRILLLIALIECLTQLVVQPILAAGKTRFYGFWQNLAALIAAVLGWAWIPISGLGAYLTVRYIYVLLPLVAYGFHTIKCLREPQKLLGLCLVTVIFSVLLLMQTLFDTISIMPPILILGLITTLFLYRHDFLLLSQTLLGPRN